MRGKYLFECDMRDKTDIWNTIGSKAGIVGNVHFIFPFCANMPIPLSIYLLHLAYSI